MFDFIIRRPFQKNRDGVGGEWVLLSGTIPSVFIGSNLASLIRKYFPRAIRFVAATCGRIPPRLRSLLHLHLVQCAIVATSNVPRQRRFATKEDCETAA